MFLLVVLLELRFGVAGEGVNPVRCCQAQGSAPSYILITWQILIIPPLMSVQQGTEAGACRALLPRKASRVSNSPGAALVPSLCCTTSAVGMWAQEPVRCWQLQRAKGIVHPLPHRIVSCLVDAAGPKPLLGL